MAGLFHSDDVALPLSYNLRNVFIRWRATLATVLGVALVVAVYMLVQSMAIGLQNSSRNTGDPRNVMIVRKGSTAESSSLVTREQFKLIEYLPEIERVPAVLGLSPWGALLRSGFIGHLATPESNGLCRAVESLDAGESET